MGPRVSLEGRKNSFQLGFFLGHFILHSSVLHDYIDDVDNVNARTMLIIFGISCTEKDQPVGGRVGMHWG